MKKIIFTILLAAISVFCTACGNTPNGETEDLPYNAKFYDKAERWMTEEYLTENETHYPFASDGLPEYICKIIDTQADYERAFDSLPEECDFSSDLLVVYVFTDIYYGFDCELRTVENNNGAVTINILHKMAPKDASGARPPSTSLPTQRCLVTKLTDCTYESINVELHNE